MPTAVAPASLQAAPDAPALPRSMMPLRPPLAAVAFLARQSSAHSWRCPLLGARRCARNTLAARSRTVAPPASAGPPSTGQYRRARRILGSGLRGIVRKADDDRP